MQRSHVHRLIGAKQPLTPPSPASQTRTEFPAIAPSEYIRDVPYFYDGSAQPLAYSAPINSQPPSCPPVYPAVRPHLWFPLDQPSRPDPPPLVDDKKKVLEFRFPGHPAPPLGMLFKMCTSIESWLLADPKNVAAVHCLTGRGRTSTVLACYLAWVGEMSLLRGEVVMGREMCAVCSKHTDSSF